MRDCVAPGLGLAERHIAECKPGFVGRTLALRLCAALTPIGFIGVMMAEAPVTDSSSWVPGFTVLPFVIAAALVLAGMALGARYRAVRLSRWHHQVASVGPFPEYSAPATYGPARALVRDAMALRLSLTSRVPLDDEQMQQLGAFMDAMSAPALPAHQTLVNVGIEPAATVQALRSALTTEGAAKYAGLEVLRVLRRFFLQLNSGGGGTGYREPPW